MKARGPKVNRVIKYFVLSDLALYAGWGFVAPIFSVFIVEQIEGATLATAGIAAAIYWSARAIAQPPIAKILDKRSGERDDFYALVGGLIGISVTAFLLVIVRTVPELYLVQAMHGIVLGVYSVSWPAIYSRHLGKGRYALDWSLDRATLAGSTAVTSLIGGFVAVKFGFDVTFMAAGILSLVAAILVFMVPEIALPRAKKKTETPEVGMTQRQGTQTTQ